MPRLRPVVWGRRALPLVIVAPYVLLAILTGVTVAAKRSAGSSLLIDLGLCALAAVWMLWMMTLHPEWHERPPVMVVFLAGLIAILTVLVIRAPWFGLFTPVAYGYTFRFLPWPWQLPALVAVAVDAATAQTSSMSKAPPSGLAIYVAVIAVNVLPVCGLAWLARIDRTRDDERERALREAGEANRRLEATLTENAGLHEQLMTQAREAGVVDERQRMAREIHDTLAQGLAGIIIQLQAVEHAERDPVDWRRHLAAATRLARESLSEARRSVNELRPEPLETARLSEALAGVAERWSALHGIPVAVATTGTVRPMRPEAEVALLRAAQESLANVARHARASTVRLTLSYLAHEVALDVHDDGRGLDPSRLDDEGAADAPHGAHGEGVPDGYPGGGFGLVAMRQRIEGLSGTLRVESGRGLGTAVSARIPVPAARR
jgi:signal transduction histidine kinase